MTFSLSRFHFRLKLVKQFLLLFGVGFLGLYFPVAGKILSPAANLTIMEVGKSQAKFNLATEKTTFSPKDEFTLTISVNTNSPIYFAQAILEFDPQVLTPKLPSRPLHLLSKHTDSLVNSNNLRISATSLDESQADPDQATSITGSVDFAAVTFKVNPNTTKTNTNVIVKAPRLTNNQLDWTTSSVLGTITNKGKIVNLLESDQTINLNIAQQEQTKNSSPLPTSTALPENFEALFAPVTDSATEVPTATSTANPSVSPAAEPTLTVTESIVTPEPQVTAKVEPVAANPSAWQRLIAFFSSLLGL